MAASPDTLSDEKIGLKVAECLGFTDELEPAIGNGNYRRNPSSGKTVMFRKFTADLNAMHAAEEKLSFDQQMDYLECLAGLCKPDVGWFPEVHATARQRAIAFVATLSGNLGSGGK